MKKVLAISGYKNSGKTTLICRILPKLIEKGFNISVIKHDGHVFDNPNTDTDQYHKAGCEDIVIFDEEKNMFIKYKPLSIESIIGSMDSDYILIEGMKHSSFDKLFIDKGIVIPTYEDITYSRDDIDEIVESIVKFYNS